MRVIPAAFATFLACTLVSGVAAEDWRQFRGPRGSGVSSETGLPITWSDTENLAWKVPLPGSGSSSPIVLGNRVFVTCYSGYGLDRAEPGNLEDLKRHLVCVDCTDGEIVWSTTVDAILPEDPFSGIGVPEHGYASNTPATDGERVYAFFGKSGVFAFDLEGNRLWRTDVGHESSKMPWGTSASLILYGDMVIVNAAEESQAILALDKATGKEVWRTEAAGLEMAYGTPQLVELGGGAVELVMPVPNEVWGLDPDTGDLKWWAEMIPDGNISPSAISADGVVYVIGGYRQFGSLAIRAGGADDVTESHVLWTSRESSYVPSVVLHEGRLYWVSDQGIAFCADAQSGETIYRERLPSMPQGRRGGKPFYASIVLADGRLYAVSRKGGAYVLAAKPEFEVLAHNTLASDTTDFNASPAVSGGRIFLRSNRFLYCLGGQ